MNQGSSKMRDISEMLKHSLATINKGNETLSGGSLVYYLQRVTKQSYSR